MINDEIISAFIRLIESIYEWEYTYLDSTSDGIMRFNRNVRGDISLSCFTFNVNTMDVYDNAVYSKELTDKFNSTLLTLKFDLL